jgi:hypothetical protein
MNRTKIATTGRDEGNNITFKVMAYRQLADDEAANVIQMYLRNLTGPKLQNMVITIDTEIGLLPGM